MTESRIFNIHISFESIEILLINKQILQFMITFTIFL